MAARSAVAAASADPRAARASVELDAARQALQRAEAAWSNRHEAAETRHLAYLAYLAQRRADAARQQAQQQADRAAALERDLQSLAARSTQRGMVVTLGDVLFATGQAILQPGAQRAAQQLASVLQHYPERRALVEGFTDNQGGAQMNLELSQRRAEAFRQALQAAGVAPGRIDVQSHGEACSVAVNDTAAGRQQNRRVEVLLSNGEGRFAGR